MSPLSKEKQKKNWIILGIIAFWIVLIFGVTMVKLSILSHAS